MWYLAGIAVPDGYRVHLFFWPWWALVFLSLRLYTRAFVIRQIGADDYLMVGAMVFNIAFMIAGMLQIKYGEGKPLEEVEIVPYLKCLLASVAMYYLAQTFYKLSIAAQSYRILSTDRSKKVLKAFFVWLFLCGATTITTGWFMCYPVAKAWDPFIEGSCDNRAAVNYASAALNILNDIFLICLPFPVLLKLQVARKHRIVLCSIFSCGVLVTIVPICRLKALYDYVTDPNGAVAITGQHTIIIGLWSLIEINLAIICGSVPGVKEFVSKVVLGRKNKESDASEESAHSRRKARTQSQPLPEVTEDEERHIGGVTGVGGGTPRSLPPASRVQNSFDSFEKGRYLASRNDDSEEALVMAGDGSTSAKKNGNVTVMSSPRRTGVRN